MKQIFRATGISLFLLLISPIVYGHLAVEHLPGTNGLIHMLTDPVHVSILVMCVVLPLLALWRKRIILLFEQIIEILFR